MDQELDADVKQCLTRLCKDLHAFLCKTEDNLNIAKQKFNQLECVLKPWSVIEKSDSKNLDCICNSLENTHISQNDEDIALLNSISKTLSNAESIRSRSVKNVRLTKELNKNKTIKDNQSLPSRKSCTSLQKSRTSRSTLKKSCSATESAQSSKSHFPSCPKYQSSQEMGDKKSSLNLTEAMTVYKVPTLLTKTIKQSYDFLSCFQNGEETLNNSHKEKFLLCLESQNEEFCTHLSEKEQFISSFPKYLSVLHSCERKKKPTIEIFPWIIYKSVNDLQIYQDQICTIHKRESWNVILKCILLNVLPVIRTSEFDAKQKLMMFKILKTICNLAKSGNHSVPIFRINMK